MMETDCTGVAPEDALQEPVELATGLHTGFGMSAIAVHGTDVFFTGELERMPIAGGDVESFGRARSYVQREKVIDFDDDYVYWTDFDLYDASVGGRIMRMT